MARIQQDLEERIRKDPRQAQQVVITLTEASQHLSAADLGLDGVQQIGDLGILTGSVTGQQLLELSKRSEIEEIVSDSEVHIHTAS